MITQDYPRKMKEINFSACKTYYLARLSQETAEDKIDRPFIPHLMRLNKIPDVVTTACCVGHKEEPIHKKDGIISLIISIKYYETFRNEIEPIIKKESCVKSIDIETMCVFLPENKVSEPLVSIWIRFKRKMFDDFIEKVINLIIERLQVEKTS